MLEGSLGDPSVPDADRAGRARHARPRDHDVPLADTRLPLFDRDRRPSRRARDPAPRLVAPRRAPARRVRLVVRRRPRRGPRANPPRHAGRDERRAPRARDAVTVFEALADAGVRTAAVNFTAYRGRTRAPADGSVPRHRARPGAVLLLQPLPERAHRRAPLVPQPRGRARSTPTPRPSGAGS